MFVFTIFSISCRFARAGSVVLALHDASDVFLEVGKMSKYSGAEALASFSFILFVLSWVVLRLIYYPFWILWSTRLEDDEHPFKSLYIYIHPQFLIHIKSCYQFITLCQINSVLWSGSCLGFRKSS